ncbi:MAG: hypothetical protein SOX70_04115 [Peptoniphilaceae bacterium]|nr:hypothetical protein [Peptoniphilaceae bacterium]
MRRVVEAKMHEQRDLIFKMIGYNSQDPHSDSELTGMNLLSLFLSESIAVVQMALYRMGELTI